MCVHDDPLQVAPLPHVDGATQRTSVRDVVGCEGQTQHRLDFARLAEHPLVAIQCITAQRPELDVFHATADDGVRLVLVKLDVKHLGESKLLSHDSFKANI